MNAPLPSLLSAIELAPRDPIVNQFVLAEPAPWLRRTLLYGLPIGLLAVGVGWALMPAHAPPPEARGVAGGERHGARLPLVVMNSPSTMSALKSSTAVVALVTSIL
mgnify:CR=1 FL=1